MKLAWVYEDKDWPSAWCCSFSPSYLSYCPPSPSSCPATSPTCATCHPPLLGILHDCLSSLLSFSFPSLHHHNPDCTTYWQTALLVPPHPSFCWQALWLRGEEQQGGTTETLSKARCFSVPQFPPCKMQVIFTSSEKHFKVFWWKRPCNTQASWLISSHPPWRAFPASRPH